VALAAAPGRDPNETRDDRLAARVVGVVLAIVLIAFLVWLVRVYLV
jgi:hypothetical protein